MDMKNKMKNKSRIKIAKIKNNIPSENMRGLTAEKWMEELWDGLMNEIAKKNSKKEIQKILEKLISKDEKKMILRRMGVLALVRLGKSYKEISEALWVSHASISTIKKNVFNTAANYKSYLDFCGGPREYGLGVDAKKLEKSSWEQLFKHIDLWEIFKNPPRPPGIGLKRSNRGD